MFRTLSLVVLALAAQSAHAGGFKVAPEIVSAAQGGYTQEMTVSLLPILNTVGGEVEIAIDIDRIGWVQAMPAAYQSGVLKECAVVAGKVRASVSSSVPFDTMYSVPICKIRFRAHLATPRGNYYTSPSSGVFVKLDGSTTAATPNLVRVIVD